MTLLILSIATFFNIVILRWKFEKGRYEDLAVDIVVLITLGLFFGGSIEGLSIATLTSMLISLYLLAYPPKWSSNAT
jgi:hypothetical protein